VKKSILLALCSAMMAAPSFGGDVQVWQGRIKQLNRDVREEPEGGLKFTSCMIKTVEPVSLPGCNSQYILFGCDGTMAWSKSEAEGMWSTVQMAYITNHALKIRVDNDYVKNGVCSALNVQLVKP